MKSKAGQGFCLLKIQKIQALESKIIERKWKQSIYVKRTMRNSFRISL